MCGIEGGGGEPEKERERKKANIKAVEVEFIN